MFGALSTWNTEPGSGLQFPLWSHGSSFELWILFWTWHMEQIMEAFQLKKSKGAKHGIIKWKHVCTNEGAMFAMIYGRLFTPTKGSTKFLSINRELYRHPLHPFIHLRETKHTHSDSIIHHKERRELVAKEGELGAVLGTTLLPANFSLLFIPSMYLLFSVLIVMSN